MDQNEAIAREMEAERARLEADKVKPKKVSRSQVNEARFVWMAGVAVADAVTAWLIWQLTAFLPYGLFWILGGAGGLLYSERLKERVGNNEEQKRIGDRGVVVSAILVLVMALFVGTVYISKVEFAWMDAVMEVTAVCLFFFHIWQSYQFHTVDDEVVNANEEARNEEEADRQIRGIHRAARIVESRKRRSLLKDAYRKDHGAALDQALLNLGLDVQQVQTKQQPPAPPKQQQEQTRDNGSNPTKGEGR